MQEKAVSRNDFIISEKFFSNLTAWTQSTWRQSKLYIEVHKPISGWEIFDLFEIDGDYSGTMQYELPFLFVPVFTYRVDGDKETKSQFIFKFKLDHENNKTIVKFVSKIEL